MKINGYMCEGAKPEVIVIPKGDTKFVFKARTINTSEWAEFDLLCPKPVPPSITTKAGTSADVNDRGYKAAIAEWTQCKTDFLIIKSLSATEGLEWDSVEATNSKSWRNWEKDLIDSGFHVPEIEQIANIIYTAQGMNSAKIEAATKAFLAEQGANL